MAVTAPPPLHDRDHSIDSDRTVEGGVIDDARERQRRHRRLGAALVTAGLAIGTLIVGLVGGGGGSGASQRAHGHPSRATPGTHASLRTPAPQTSVPAAGSFGLLAPRVGWLSGGPGLYLTRNGGHSWAHLPAEIVGPADAMGWSSSPSPSELAFSFADGGQNSLTIPHGVSATSWDVRVHGQVEITTDAGRTWSSHAFVPHRSPGALSFLSSRLGFVLGYAAAAHHAPRASLYETRDGARTWKRIARLPFTGMVSFANPHDGLGGGWSLAAGLVDGGAIYRTGNGGRSWSKISLCRLKATCEAPKLFSSGRGVVLVTAGTQRTNGGPTRVEVYTTRNNGISWTRHILPDTPSLTSGQNYIPFSAPNANDLFAWVSPYLYASHDGGKRWSRYADPALNRPGLQPGFADIAFANGSYGWYGDVSLFEYTTDGGKHWTKLSRAG